MLELKPFHTRPLCTNNCCREQGKKVVNGSEVILFIVLALKGCQARNPEAIP